MQSENTEPEEGFSSNSILSFIVCGTIVAWVGITFLIVYQDAKRAVRIITIDAPANATFAVEDCAPDEGMYDNKATFMSDVKRASAHQGNPVPFRVSVMKNKVTYTALGIGQFTEKIGDRFRFDLCGAVTVLPDHRVRLEARIPCTFTSVVNETFSILTQEVVTAIVCCLVALFILAVACS